MSDTPKLPTEEQIQAAIKVAGQFTAPFLLAHVIATLAAPSWAEMRDRLGDLGGAEDQRRKVLLDAWKDSTWLLHKIFGDAIKP